MIKHDGHLRTRGKCRKHEPLVSVFYISRFFDVAKNNKPRFFYGLYSDKPWVFDQSESPQGPIYVIIPSKLIPRSGNNFNNWGLATGTNWHLHLHSILTSFFFLQHNNQLCLPSTHPLLINPIQCYKLSCAPLHDSATRAFSHGQRQQDPTSQDK